MLITNLGMELIDDLVFSLMPVEFLQHGWKVRSIVCFLQLFLERKANIRIVILIEVCT